MATQIIRLTNNGAFYEAYGDSVNSHVCFRPQLQTFSDPIIKHLHEKICTLLYFMCLTFQKQHYYFIQLLLLLSFPPISISDVSFLVTLPNCVWAVICRVPLSVTKMRWQGPSGSSHYTTWTSNTYIMAGLEKEQGDGRELYTAREYTRQKLAEILQPKREELH